MIRPSAGSARAAERGLRRRGRVATALAVALASVFPIAAPRVDALTVAAMRLDELTSASTDVVRARCVARQVTRDGGGRIESIARFAVLDRVKGVEAAEVDVRQLGGRLGGDELIVPGAPLSEPGDEAVLFLEPGPDGALQVVGLALGYLPVATTPGGESRVRVWASLGVEFAGGGIRSVSEVLERVRAHLGAEAAAR